MFPTPIQNWNSRSKFIYFTLVMFTLVAWLLPLVIITLASFMTADQLNSGGRGLNLPSPLSIDGWITAINNEDFRKSFLNSFIIVTPVVIISIGLATMAGFALSKYKFRGQLLIFAIFIGGNFDNSIFTVSGISTLGVTTSSSLSAKELFVSGVTTTTSLKVGTSITASDGIVTATSFSTGEVGTGINIGLSSITGPSNLIIDPSAVGDDTGKVTIKGDLFVLGTETNVSSQTIELADHRVGIATTVTTNELLDGGGISIGDTDVLKTFTFHNTTNTLRSSVGLGVTSGQEFKIGINTVLNSTTLGSGITFSSLTKLGTLSNLNITGLSTFTGIATFSTDVNIGGTLTALDIDGGEY